jgi:hypothetical protein
MYLATGDIKYLVENLRIICATLANRDDKLGRKTFSGQITPAWGADKYAKRWVIHLVHTGKIVKPVLEFLREIKNDPNLPAKLHLDANEITNITSAVTESLDWHERQWLASPDVNEGCYLLIDEEEGFDGRPQPFNRLSLMGYALWESWKVAGNAKHRDKAIMIARYIKNRLAVYSDGAYYWDYWLPTVPITVARPLNELKGEDLAHTGCSVVFCLELAIENQVFTKQDIKAFSNTVTKGFARLNNGILFPTITGRSYDTSLGYMVNVGYWLACTECNPEVYRRIADFFLRYRSDSPSPIDLSKLVQYRTCYNNFQTAR